MNQVRIKTSETSSALIDSHWLAVVDGKPYVCGKEVKLSDRPIVRTDASPPDTDHVTKNQLANQLQILLDTARELGFIITVENVALVPLEMRNTIMIGNVRHAR